MSWSETVAIGLATLVGPIAAVAVTRWNDRRHQTRERKMIIFRMLMATRRLEVSNDHVQALNLIEVEFHKSPEVMDAWQKLSAHLTADSMQPTPEEWNNRLRQIKAKLLGKIAEELGYSVTNLDIFAGGYAPKAWQINEDRTRHLTAYLFDLANHRNALPVALREPPQFTNTEHSDSKAT